MSPEAPSGSATADLSALSPRRDWLDATVRLATSWVGLFSAYAIAVVMLLKNYTELTEGLNAAGLPVWAGIALLCAFPLGALLFSTFPTWLDQRRVTRYAELTGPLAKGYFTLRPREKEDEDRFDRADNAHQDVLRWLEHRNEPVLYLTGASGTGKSSLLAAWVLPKLTRNNHIVISLRGYETDLLARLTEKLSESGLVWDKLPVRASERLVSRRLVVIIDQFEEFLILKNGEEHERFRQFLISLPTRGVTVLLVYRPEYEHLIQDSGWPHFLLDTRRVVPPFTENSAQEFLRQSGQTIAAPLMRDVLREAADLDQTPGLIRPVTLNMCGLVLGRFSGGLPRRFRGGLIRAFLRESLLLPEVRDVAERLIPGLITENITKRPRQVAEFAAATQVPVTAVRAALRRLGEADRGIVHALDANEDTWEISHDFLVPLLDALVARRTVSWWRRARPWLPWTGAAMITLTVAGTALLERRDARMSAIVQGWNVSMEAGELTLARDTPIPSTNGLQVLQPPLKVRIFGQEVEDVSALRELKNLTTLLLDYTRVEDVSMLRELKNLTNLDLSGTKVTDVSALRELKNLKRLSLRETHVTDVSALRELKNLTMLDLHQTQVTDLSALRELPNLTVLFLNFTSVTDVSVLRELKNLKTLDLSGTKVTDVSTLRELKNLTALDIDRTQVTDVTALRELKNLTRLDLRGTRVTDVSALRELKNLTTLDLGSTRVTDVSALRELKNLTTLDLSGTKVANVSALRELKNLTTLDLSGTNVTDVSALRELKNLTTLDLSGMKVTDVSALRELKDLTTLDLSETKVKDVSALRELKNLTMLDLHQTQVTDLSALRDLSNLTALFLNFTSVTDVSVLRELRNLTTLDLRSTRVTDVSALRELKDLSVHK